MKIKVAGGAYQEDYRRMNTQECVNWYPHYFAPIEVIQPEQGSAKMYLKPRPGLLPFADTGVTTGVRAMHSHNNRLFFVVHNVLYELTAKDTISTLGTMTNLDTSVGRRLYMVVNGNQQIGIFGGTVGYYYDLNTSTLAQITDIDFDGADTFDYMDGYGIGTFNGRVCFSELNDFSNWVGDSIYTPTYEADDVIRVMKLHSLIWNFGHTTIEPYYNDGTTPFSRSPQGSIDIGLYGAHTPAKYQDGIFYVGRSRRGTLGIYLLNSQQKNDLVSPGSINRSLSKLGNKLANAYGIVEESGDAHVFYHLCIPEADTTFTFDLITKEWHERKSEKPFVDENGVKQQGHWRVNCMDFFDGKYVAGDYYSGQIFEVDPGTLTDDSLPIKRTRVAGIYDAEQKYINVSEIIINASTGLTTVTDPVLMFSASVDGGNTYRTERFEAIGNQGAYGERITVRKLGTGRNWAIKLELTDAVDLAIMNASARGSVGAR